MKLAEVIAGLPDDCRCSLTVGAGDLTVGELRAALAAEMGDRLVTTGGASSELGYSADSWRTWAEGGLIAGAFQDEGAAGTWRLPLRACREHIERLRGGNLNRRRRRHGWDASAAQATSARPTGDLEGEVGIVRLEAVGRRPADDEEPRSARVAGTRRADRGQGAR